MALTKEVVKPNLHYVERYNRFIDSLKNQIIEGYKEEHHIIPKSMGGTDEKVNLIELTARQHFIAHWILSRAYRGKMSNAFWLMANIIKNSNRYTGVKITSRVYEEAKRSHAENESLKVLTEEQKKNIGDFHRGRKRSLETRKKMSEACKGRVFSDEHKLNLSLSHKDKKQSEETIQKRIQTLAPKRKQATLKMLQTMANKTEFEKEQINKKRSESKRLYWLNKKLSKVDSLDGHIGD